MELILGYVLFALTTATACLISLHIPVVKMLQQLENPPDVVRGTNGILMYVVLFVTAALAAPPMLIIYLVPQYSERFKQSLFDNLLTEEADDL